MLSGNVLRGSVNIHELSISSVEEVEAHLDSWDYNSNVRSHHRGFHYTWTSWKGSEADTPRTALAEVLLEEEVEANGFDYLRYVTIIDGRVFAHLFHVGSDYTLELFTPVDMTSRYSEWDVETGASTYARLLQKAECFTYFDAQTD